MTIRGIERRKIFRDDENRNHFLERLSILVPETKTLCYAWGLVPNHARFLLRSGPFGISLLIRRLLTGYAGYFISTGDIEDMGNYSRTGSNPSSAEDAYLQERVEGGLIRSLGGWKEARKLRLNGQDRINGDQRILGEGDFVSEVLSDSGESFNRKYEFKSRGVNFYSVLERASSLWKKAWRIVLHVRIISARHYPDSSNWRLKQVLRLHSYEHKNANHSLPPTQKAGRYSSTIRRFAARMRELAGELAAYYRL